MVEIKGGDQDELVTVVASSHLMSQVSAWSLVLHSASLPHSIFQESQWWHLSVSSPNLALAQQEISLYEEENAQWPMSEYGAVPEQSANPPTLFLLGLFVLFYGETGPWLPENIWFSLGSVDSRLVVEQKQWWRLVTALTLHADIAHLVGNMAIGGIIIHFLTKSIGTGLGWFLLLVMGSLGNGLNVFFHSSTHHSVGFSTALFAAIGTLCTLEALSRASKRRSFLALGGGVALFAMFSSSEARVDVGAHLWGGVLGLLCGSGLGGWVRKGKAMPGATLQLFLFVLAVVVVWGSWWLAFNLS